MPSECIIEVTEDEFEKEVITFSESTPVIVLFRANWSGASKM